MLGDQWRNLIAEFKVTSTRTSLYDKAEPYADYVFVTQGVEVNAFSVLDAVVSDHAPLYLEFSVSSPAILKSEELSVSSTIEI